MSITQIITALPEAPSPTDTQAEFDTKSFAHVAAQAGLVTELNTFGAQANALAVDVAADAAAAAASAAAATSNGAAQVALAADQVALAADQVALAADQVALAAAQVDLAANHADTAAISAAAAAASANFVGEWAALAGALAMPATVRHGGRFWVLLTSLADVTAAEPGISAAWAGTAAAGAPDFLLMAQGVI